MSDPLNQALVDLIKDCIAFHEAMNNTDPLHTLFDVSFCEVLQGFHLTLFSFFTFSLSELKVNTCHGCFV